MPVSKKQLLHYQQVARQSLEKFKKIILQMEHDDRELSLLINSWESFINNEARFLRYSEHVTDISSVIGFSRELSSNLSYDELVNRVAQRFAELDLAEHIIRELNLDSSGGKVEKIPEEQVKKCDFKTVFNSNVYYFESKYTKNISASNLEKVTKKALAQIKESIEKNGIGCIWIFTYSQPEKFQEFQDIVMAIKMKLLTSDFDFNLNVQVYSRGLYGDAGIIWICSQ